jgi:hypothetical protein
MEVCLDIFVSSTLFLLIKLCRKTSKKCSCVFHTLIMILDVKYAGSFTSEMYAISLILCGEFLVSCASSNLIFFGRNKVVNTPKILL